MDPFKETAPKFRKAKKSTSTVGPPPTAQTRPNTSEDVVMSEPAPRISSVGGPMSISTPIGHSSTPGPSLSAGRQPGNSLMRKKTTATKFVSPLVTTKSTTPRVRFAQHKSVTVPRPSAPVNTTPAQNRRSSFATPSLPARKAGSNLFPPFQKQPKATTTTNAQQTPVSTKTARAFVPLWQQLDEEFERVHRRKREIRRISSTTTARQTRENIGQGGDRMRKKSRIGPNLRLRLEGEVTPSSSEAEDDRPRIQSPAAKLGGGSQVALKKTAQRKTAQKTSAPIYAARKIELEDADPSDESSEGPKSGSTKDADSQEDQLFPEEYDLPVGRRHETPLRASTVFNPAPQITIALPQVKVEPGDDPPAETLSPPEELVNALEALTIGPIRMQATQQLPFLRRNLRRGFIIRCGDVLIPIHSDQKHVSLEVTYEYVDGFVFQATVEDWLCPLCNLFGKFTTQAILYCHLKWDHKEVVSEWEQIEESDVQQKWKLQIIIPQDLRDDGQAGHVDQEEDEQEEEDEAEIPDEQVPRPPSSTASRLFSPFRSVTLSLDSVRPKSETEREITPDIPISKIKLSGETPEPSISQSLSVPPPPSTRSRSRRSTTGITTTTTQRMSRDSRYPTPPPPDDPLGPAARPPYLPAYSEYGGPDIYYSCRPGGACLFDLLGTLPMKQFGILDWEVLDREEEIYESDDIKEEYKVMHALWARWIMINRKEFIADYHRGTIGFVDYYWRMIHRAAGWDALRYWLLILLANQLLTAHQVAQVLIHYEELTGMATWCDTGV